MKTDPAFSKPFILNNFNVFGVKKYTLLVIIFTFSLAYQVKAQPGWNKNVISDTMGNAQTLFAKDISSNGAVDVVVANDTMVVLFENNGGGNFKEILITDSISAYLEIFAEDVNEDGNIDVITTSSLDSTVVWFENDGSQNFTEHIISYKLFGLKSPFATDMNGDDTTDILAASGFESTIVWYENDGNGNFTNRYIISDTTDYPSKVYAADMNKDGDMDVLSVSGTTTGEFELALYENDGSQNFIAHIISDTLTGTEDVYATDINGDDTLDILTQTGGSDEKILWYENEGGHNFTQHVLANTSFPSQSVYPIDMNNNGHNDVLSAEYDGDHLLWYQNDSSQNFTAHEIPFTIYDATDVFGADVDGTGGPEVLATSSKTGADHVVWFDPIFTTYDTVNRVACDSFTLPSGRKTYYTSGTYTDTLNNYLGFDSLLTINLTVKSSYQISGKVYEPGGTIVSDTTYLSGFRVDTARNKIAPSKRDTLISSGTYQLNNVCGQQLIMAVPEYSTMFLKTYYPSMIRWEKAHIVPGFTDTSGVDIAIQDRQQTTGGDGLIRGKVIEGKGYSNKRTQGDPLANVNCAIVETGRDSIYQSTTTDSTGAFKFANLPPGNYNIYADVTGLPVDTTGLNDFTISDGGTEYDSVIVEADSEKVHVRGKTVSGIGKRIPHTALTLHRLYPNPVDQNLQLEVSNTSNAPTDLDVRILDVKGRTQYRHKHFRMASTGRQQFSVSMEGLPAGPLMVTLQATGSSEEISTLIIHAQ